MARHGVARIGMARTGKVRQVWKTPERSKDRALVLLDVVSAVLLLVSGSMHFASSGDLSWICWMFIGICLYLRIWILTGACRMADDRAETWRALYQTQADVSLGLAFENEMLRKERETDGDVK